MKGHEFIRAVNAVKKILGFSPCGLCFLLFAFPSGFYETAGNVKVFVVVFAFVFSLVAFLFLLLRLRLSFVRVLKNHLGLLYALAGSR